MVSLKWQRTTDIVIISNGKINMPVCLYWKMLSQYLIIQHSAARPIKATFVSLFVLDVFMVFYYFQTILFKILILSKHNLFLSCVIQVYLILRRAAVSILLILAALLHCSLSAHFMKWDQGKVAGAVPFLTFHLLYCMCITFTACVCALCIH